MSVKTASVVVLSSVLGGLSGSALTAQVFKASKSMNGLLTLNI
jgi:hypothetical protein